MDNCTNALFEIANNKFDENDSTVELVIANTELPLFAVVIGLAGFEICFAILCFLFNCIFKRQRYEYNYDCTAAHDVEDHPASSCTL